MAKKRDKNSEQSFIATVSKFSNDRLHVEVPKKHRDKTVKDGDAVRVENIEWRDPNTKDPPRIPNNNEESGLANHLPASF